MTQKYLSWILIVKQSYNSDIFSLYKCTKTLHFQCSIVYNNDLITKMTLKRELVKSIISKMEHFKSLKQRRGPMNSFKENCLQYMVNKVKKQYV